MSYVDGYLLSIPKDKIEEYRKVAEGAGKIWIEHGALEYRECLGEDLAGNEFCGSFAKLLNNAHNETVIFAYVVYRSREERDAINQKVQTDPRMTELCKPEEMPFDVSRMYFGGFTTLVKH